MVYNCTGCVMLKRRQTQMLKLCSEYTNHYCNLILSGYNHFICNNQHAHFSTINTHLEFAL